ncbi:MAG: choice-of-anchor D domain-containing protein, partial [Terriglobales bacterium]
LAISLVITGGLLLLTGCQGLAGGTTGGGTVGLGSGSLNFGSVPIGSSKTLPDTITNNTSSAVTISSIQGLGSGFQITGITAPLSLAAGQSASFNVQFQSTSTGDPTATISFDGPNAQAYASLSASATAVTLGTLSPSPSSVAFGSINVGATPTNTVTLQNSGGTSLTITSATLSGAGFTMSNLALPLTINAGASTSATITFAPPGTGNFSGSVTFATTSNQTNSTVVLPFTGTGVAVGTLSPNPASLAFGSVQIDTSKSLAGTLTNTGGTSLTISAATASTGFSLTGLSLPVTLTAGQSTSFTALFSPTTSGAASGSVSITSTGSNPSLSIPLSGTGVTQGDLVANTTSLAFGSVQINTSKSLSETLTNTGGSSVTITQADVTGAVFSVAGLTLPLTLTANQSVTFTATFTPTGAAPTSGSLSVVSNASNSPLNIALSGTGTATGKLAVSPTSPSFGNVVVGSSSALNGSLTASGASVTVSSASLNNSEFVLSGISLPATLTAGQSTSFTVTFTPQSSGATSASLSFSSNASNSPTVQSMTGTGTAATQHTVDLTWTASTSAVGYNLYRGTVSGGPYTMINSSLDSTTAYTDGTVVSGQTYYYVARAVDTSGNESGYSNQATAVIPTP